MAQLQWGRKWDGRSFGIFDHGKTRNNQNRCIIFLLWSLNQVTFRCTNSEIWIKEELHNDVKLFGYSYSAVTHSKWYYDTSYFLFRNEQSGWWRSWLARRSHSFWVILRSRVRASLTPFLWTVECPSFWVGLLPSETVLKVVHWRPFLFFFLGWASVILGWRFVLNILPHKP